MRTFSSADAKNHFGELIDAARLAPVAVMKYDKPFVVVMGVEEFERLKSQISTKKSNLILRKREK
jgi:prevent-host-death family protein